MLKEMFIGRPPSHFQMNPIVKAFIISETFIWSSWNAIIPIFAVFAVNIIAGGSIEVAASSFSVYLIVRVIFELISGRYLSKSTEFQKFIVSIIGILFISVGYFGFALTKTVLQLYIFYGVVGIGLGIASPAKNSLFSMHLDKDREASEWGVYDATVFFGMAVSATLGGLLVKTYGFSFLFYLVSVINLLGIIPYLLYMHKKKEVFKIHDKAVRVN